MKKTKVKINFYARGITIKRRSIIINLFVAILLVLSCFVVTTIVSADDGDRTTNPYLVRTFVDEQGRLIDEVIFPGKPPDVKAESASVPDVHIMGVTNSITNVPTFDWSYGCSATSAAMLAGYYDRTGYNHMYAGPTNGGVCPLDNSSWGSTDYPSGTYSECPLSATNQGKDGLATKGHVDDYWIDYFESGPDPYEGNWTEHTQGDCTGDFMGTNQWKYSNVDGSTTFYIASSGDPLSDYTGSEPSRRDGCHGLKLFFESRGYRVTANYSQYILGYASATKGFTFADFQAEIDAGRPVLIHLEGHTMLGFGYDTTGNTVYLHDTWDHLNHSMTWGGTYGGLQQMAVTVLQLQPLAWGSYSDAGHTTTCDSFSDYSTQHTAYIYGTGFTADTQYRVVFWDEVDSTWYNRATVDATSDSSGKLSASHTFASGTDTEGNWHCTVYDSTSYSPTTYDAGDTHIVADDTSYTGGYAFVVAASAIPEFSTVIAGIAVAGTCFGIYYWMRKRRPANA